MPSQPFIIRSSPPPRGEDEPQDSSTGRSARWGLGRRSQSSSLHHGKPRFVRESRASRAWTGDWTREDEVADPEENEDDDDAAPTVEDSVADSTPPAASSPASNSMASLYAQIAARIASNPSTSATPTQAQPEAGPSSLHPRLLTKRKRAPPPQRSDWFIAKASEQLGRQQASRVLSSSSLSKASDSATAAPSTGSQPATTPSPSPSLHPCPTCSQLLPSPCPATVLRAHLDSIAHRMAQSTSRSTPRPPVPAATTPTEALPRNLFLDASNAGYRALQTMGWKEGWGIGEKQWERLQEQAVRDAERRVREEVEEEERRLRRREEAIVVSDSEEDDEEEGDVLFGPLQVDQERSPVDEVAATSSVPSPRDGKEERPPPEQPRSHDGPAPAASSSQPHPLLEPIAVQLKRDRLGLGRLRAATGREYPTLGASGSSSAVADSTKKRRREERDAEMKKRRDIVREHERERREWLEVRQSLN